MTVRKREIDERIELVRRELKLLAEHSQQAFSERRREYAGEVAGKLRVLCVSAGRNHPLLLEAMRDTGIQPILTFNSPLKGLDLQPLGDGRDATLADYLASYAMGFRVSTGEFKMHSVESFIRAWAEKEGAAHVDPTIPEADESAIKSPYYLGNVSVSLRQLQAIVKVVLQAGDRFLREWDHRKATARDNAS